MLASILWVVLVPLTAGALINTRFGARLSRVRRIFPLVSVLAIVVIIAIIVGLTAPQLPIAGGTILVAVALHNAGGLAAGYGLGRSLCFSQVESRTLAIEVGMQNSRLGVALAHQYFTTLASLPGAVLSIWHSLSGCMLAAAWARRAPKPKQALPGELC
jgi:BASS family bile acid:Na+ symporter